MGRTRLDLCLRLNADGPQLSGAVIVRVDSTSEQIEQFVGRQSGAHVCAFQQTVGEVAFGAVHFDDLFFDRPLGHQTVDRYRTRLTETVSPVRGLVKRRVSVRAPLPGRAAGCLR